MSDLCLKLSLVPLMLGSFVSMAADATLAKLNPETFASQQADAVVYINTLQAKESMAPKLWEQIQKDKNHALDAEKNSSGFNLKNRDLEIIFNFFLDSAVPFHFHITGAAVISGDIAEDIKKLQSFAKSSNTLHITEEKQEKGSRYHVVLDPENGDSPIHLTFFLSNGKILFQIASHNPKALPVQQLAGQNRQAIFSPFGRYSVFSYAITAKPEKFSTTPFFSTPKNKALSKFLSMTESLHLTGKIQGIFLQTTVKADFKTSALAASYFQQISPFIKRYSPSGEKQDVISAEASLLDRSIRIEAAVNLAVVWNFFSNAIINAPELDISNEPEDEEDE